MISCTPATRAGTAFITTVDGYDALPPGHVETNSSQRRHLHSDDAAIVLGHVEAGLPLPLVVLGDSPDRPAQRLAQRRGNPAECAVPGARVEFPGLRGQVHTVEAESVLADCLISSRRNVIEDRVHHTTGLGIGSGEPRQQRFNCLEGRHRQAADQVPPSLGRRWATRL